MNYAIIADLRGSFGIALVGLSENVYNAYNTWYSVEERGNVLLISIERGGP